MKNDILHTLSSELKTMPFDVPEGYFDSLRDQMRNPQTQRQGTWQKIAPYVSMAAAFLLIVTAGRVLLNQTLLHEEMTYEDYIVYSGMDISCIYEDDMQVAEASSTIAEDDIIEYLIFTGYNAESMEE